MVLIFRIIATFLICTSSSLFALGTQFLLIPIDAPNLAIGSHVSWWVTISEPFVITIF